MRYKELKTYLKQALLSFRDKPLICYPIQNNQHRNHIDTSNTKWTQKWGGGACKALVGVGTHRLKASERHLTQTHKQQTLGRTESADLMWPWGHSPCPITKGIMGRGENRRQLQRRKWLLSKRVVRSLKNWEPWRHSDWDRTGTGWLEMKWFVR